MKEKNSIKMSLGFALLIFFIIVLLVTIIVVFILRKDKIIDKNESKTVKSNTAIDTNLGKFQEEIESDKEKDISENKYTNNGVNYQKIYIMNTNIAVNQVISDIDKFNEFKNSLIKHGGNISTIEKYDEDYFKNHSLAVALITDYGSGQGIKEKIEIVNDTVYADYERVYTNETGVAVEGTDILMIEVDKSITKIKSSEFISDPLPEGM